MPVTRKCTVLVSAVFIFVAMTTLARAILTDWTIDHSPIALGDGVGFNAVEDGKHVVQNYAWEWSCKEAGCAGNWVNFGNAKAVNLCWFTVNWNSCRLVQMR